MYWNGDAKSESGVNSPSWIVTLDVLKLLFQLLLNVICFGWIVTLDVLKLQNKIEKNKDCELNSNIRCIEMIMRRALYLVHYVE